ncbi:hypothetical protein RGQ15_11835 [Paracoccus sp. MBLB3053]|uniref:Uncharacterized protein n=1 Tax=Paracoccus aurantius TaxID=3073814 RepID=A0ABU2HT84_9RHOB|nr:hypothetical protein [Paracoccus sp. MBLB3053]MDS9468258.1 hypothetical protein [Paracoccus sp. MBLB3053]
MPRKAAADLALVAMDAPARMRRGLRCVPVAAMSAAEDMGLGQYGGHAQAKGRPWRCTGSSGLDLFENRHSFQITLAHHPSSHARFPISAQLLQSGNRDIPEWEM